MNLTDENVSAAILEMRDLLRLLAGPAVAERDKKAREDLKRIVGVSQLKSKAVMLMDGSRNQAAIHKESSMQKSHLSTLVKQLGEASLLAGDVRQPKIAIILPANFFEGEIR